MRTWRVGSISMGALLLFLGVLLLLSQLLHLKVAAVLMAWWPVILIVLGIEILLHLFFSKQENPIVKYDFLSIIIVGIIGMAGIGLTVLTTVGVLDKVNDWMNIETKTMDLPEYNNPVGNTIKRVVVNTGSHSHSLTVEGSSTKDVSIFGSYRTQTLGNEAVIQSVKDYVLVKEKGDTLYVEFKEIYNLPQPFQDWVHIDATIIVPSDIKLEANGGGNDITLKPRNLLNDWLVDHVYEVNVLVENDANMFIHAQNVHDLSGDGWEGNNKKADIEEPRHSGTMKIGAGTSTLSISDADIVSVIKP